MMKYLAAVAFAAALAQPASAITFSKLTTIYIGSGVKDDGGGQDAGVATLFNCSNVSGVSASVRFLVLNPVGQVLASKTYTPSHGSTLSVATHATVLFSDDNLATFGVSQGVVNIESTQSGVFCTAMIVDAASTVPNGITLPLVRVNPHPGTVE